jgi:putative transposase
MSHHSTVFAQLLNLIPRHEFEQLANAHQQGRRRRPGSRWAQCLMLMTAQLTGRTSLRDIVANVGAQTQKLYHLGVRVLPRSTFARINESQPSSLYEALFLKLLSRTRTVAPGHPFQFKNKLLSLDSTTIDLCLSVFPWAKYQYSKGAIKLHIGLDHAGFLPSFMTLTDGKQADITVARTLDLPKGSIVAMDRGYIDYQWMGQLTEQGVFFVSRLKSNARYTVVERQKLSAESRAAGVTSDQVIRCTDKTKTRREFRRVGYRDAKTGKRFYYLSNQHDLPPETIADIYASRWQVELFFKWIKQNLKIKSFVGTSKNAVLSQVWAAMCVYLILAYLKFMSQTKYSLHQITRLLHLNLFERRDLMALIRGESDSPPLDSSNQLNFRY